MAAAGVNKIALDIHEESGVEWSKATVFTLHTAPATAFDFAKLKKDIVSITDPKLEQLEELFASLTTELRKAEEDEPSPSADPQEFEEHDQKVADLERRKMMVGYLINDWKGSMRLFCSELGGPVRLHNSDYPIPQALH